MLIEGRGDVVIGRERLSGGSLPSFSESLAQQFTFSSSDRNEPKPGGTVGHSK